MLLLMTVFLPLPPPPPGLTIVCDYLGEVQNASHLLAFAGVQKVCLNCCIRLRFPLPKSLGVHTPTYFVALLRRFTWRHRKGFSRWKVLGKVQFTPAPEVWRGMFLAGTKMSYLLWSFWVRDAKTVVTHDFRNISPSFYSLEGHIPAGWVGEFAGSKPKKQINDNYFISFDLCHDFCVVTHEIRKTLFQ